MGGVGQVKNPAYEPSGAVSGLPWKDLGTYGYGGSFLTARHITEALMPTAIPRARRGSTESATQRFGALLLALGVSRFLRPRQPNSRQGGAEKRPVPISDCKTAKAHTGSAAEQKKVTESDRGRAATKPSEIPAKGWKDILWRVYQEVSRDRVFSVAAGVTSMRCSPSSPPLQPSYRFTGSSRMRLQSASTSPSSEASFRPAQSRLLVSR